MSFIPIGGRIKKATGVITKISLDDNLVLNMIQLLFILINLIATSNDNKININVHDNFC